MGVSPDCNMYSLKTLSEQGGTVSAILSALDVVVEFVATSGRKSIVSMSLGGKCETEGMHVQYVHRVFVSFVITLIIVIVSYLFIYLFIHLFFYLSKCLFAFTYIYLSYIYLSFINFSTCLFALFLSIFLSLDCSEDTLVMAVGIISDKGITVSVAAGNEGDS